MTAPPRSDDGPAVDGRESAPIRVLHVDDEPAVGSMTADFLERESEAIQVVAEQSARAGLDRLANEEIHCVVSDHDMADTNGIEFLRAVRDEHDDLPFILFTGKGSEEIASEAISAGVTDYLQKETGSDQYTVLANRIENAVEQYRTGNALENERTRRSALFENTPDPIMETEIVDERLVVRSVNPAFEDVFGFESDDIVGRTVSEAVIPNGAREEYEDIRERVLSGEAVQTTVNRETTDGTRDFRLRAIPVTSSDGTPVGDYAWYTDITEQKQQRRRMEALANAFPDLAFVIDEDGRNVDLLGNSQSEDWLYADPGDTLGEHVQDIFPAEQSDEFMSMIRRTLETDRTTTAKYQLDVQVGTRWFEARIAPLSVEIDGKRAVTWVSRDVTDAKERRRQLERQNEQLDEFASIVSHDLRNPLGVLQGSLALAEESGDPADFDRCRRAADRMEALVDGLLTLAREGASVEGLERVELSEVVESCWCTVETYDATLRVEADATIRADAGRLRQLLENLFRNAVEHGGEDVTVAVGTFESADGFYVEDDGPGIPGDERSSVFESGYSTAPEGTGFGLSIAKQIAEAHDWNIEAAASDDGGARLEIKDIELV